MRSTDTALIVVISGPSGVGKDALIERMAELGHQHHFTVTATTRAPRPNEQDGVNHHFVAREQFMDMVSKDELLEWAQVYGNFYGVPKQQVRDALRDGRHVLLRVDVQGAKRLRTLVPEALFIFVMPPSMEALRQHIERRGVNSPEEIDTRLTAAQEEMKQSDCFDYCVLNEENHLDDTVSKVAEIIDSEAHRDPPRKIVV
ncbi:MAG: guanylate kinase [Dehalococcoidia bacterium]